MNNKDKEFEKEANEIIDEVNEEEEDEEESEFLDTEEEKMYSVVPKIKQGDTNVNLSISKPDEDGDISFKLNADISGVIKGVVDSIKNIIN